MKHIKKFETYRFIKKYVVCVLVESKRKWKKEKNVYYILEVVEDRLWSKNNKVLKTKILHKYVDGIEKFKELKRQALSLDVILKNDNLKNIVFTSDNLQECIDYAILADTTNKYNL